MLESLQSLLDPLQQLLANPDSVGVMAPYLAAFVIGFLGGGHCIGMCGGVMAALSFAVPASERGKRWRILLSYNAGRILSYALIGALAGGIGFQLASGHGLSVMRIIAGLLLIAMGLYLANWWRGLTYLEQAGGILWRRIQPLGKSLMPVKSSGAGWLLGMLWGWLPCGLVYTALAYGLAQADAMASAGVMLAFGLGTLPAVLASGVFAERTKALMQRQGFRVIMASLIILFGVWTVWGTLGHMQHADHAQHGSHGQSGDGVDHSQHMPQAVPQEGLAKDEQKEEPKGGTESSHSHHHHH